jgi:hypothetical protein
MFDRLARWWADPRLPMSVTTWLRVSWLLVLGSIVGYPVSALTFASGEPPVVLFLSWFAVFTGALAVVVTVEVRAQQDG